MVASIIFIIATIGLFSSLSGLRTTSSESKKRLAAANYGRQVLEALRANVDDRSWGNGCAPTVQDLSITPPDQPCDHGPFTTVIESTTYTAQYTVTPQIDPGPPPQEIGRAVNITVTWLR